MPTILISILAFALSGCLESPILNHANASPKKPKEAPLAESRQELPEGCDFHLATKELCASLEWVTPASDETEGELRLRFWSAKSGTLSGPYVDPGHTVFVKLWMASMGHGSSPVTVAQAKDQAGQPIVGVYDATRVHFVMGGDWEIWVQLRQEKKVIDQAKIDVQI